MTEMEKLIKLLAEAKIPFKIRDCWGTLQVGYPNFDNLVCDAVCHSFSYGHEEGLLEIMGLVDEEEVGDSVEGYLTAEEVFERIKTHYEATKAD